MPKAPRLCPGDDGQCRELITHGAYCPEHTRGWNNPANRTASSRHTGTRAFQRIAREVKQRDKYQCQIQLPGICIGHGNTVDHIVPVSQRPDLADDPKNLRAACRPCNEHLGRKVARRSRQSRPAPRHPGLVS